MEVIEYLQPPSLNKLINTARTNRFIAAKDKKDWTTYIAKHSIINLTNTYKNPYVAAEISYSRASSDLDNLAACFKSVLDGLVKAEIITNDNLSTIQPVMLYRAVKVSTKEKAFFRLYITDCPQEYQTLALQLISC